MPLKIGRNSSSFGFKRFGCVLVLGVACSGRIVKSQTGVHPHVVKHLVEVVFPNLAVGIALIVFDFYIPNMCDTAVVL